MSMGSPDNDCMKQRNLEQYQYKNNSQSIANFRLTFVITDFIFINAKSNRIVERKIGEMDFRI